MAHYSSREGRWINRGRTNAPEGPSPHSPESPGFAERNRSKETKLEGGLIRVDYGAPDAPAPAKPKQRPTPPAPPDPPPAPAVPQRAPEESWKRHVGLGPRPERKHGS